jgi:hypothetical protein
MFIAACRIFFSSAEESVSFTKIPNTFEFVNPTDTNRHL